MSRPVKTGSVDQSIRVWAYDSDGAAITGEAWDSAGIVVSVVVRSAGQIVSTTALTLVARSTPNQHRDNAFTEVSGGEYVVDLPDSYSATANRDVSVTLTSTAIAGGYVLSETLAVGIAVELDSGTLSILNDIPTTAEFEARTIAAANYATASQINSLQVNTRASVQVPVEIETPDSGTQIWKIRLFLFDSDGNMEAPDSTPTVALVNASGTDRSSRLSSATTISTGAYSWNYTSTDDDAEEQLNWTFTVVEGGLTRLYPATTRVVEETEERFTSADRSTLNSRATQTAVTTVGEAVAAVDTKLGTPAGATISEDIASTKAAAEAALLSVESIAATSAEAY